MFKFLKHTLILASLSIIVVIVQKATCLDSAKNDQNVKNVTIWVHGTKTITGLLPRVFHVPKGLNKAETIDKKYYIKKMAETLCKAHPQEFSHDDFYTFGWSGGLGSDYRYEAAQDLCKVIEDLIANYKAHGLKLKLTIITHSHGGNVALNLSSLDTLSKKLSTRDERVYSFSVDRLVLLACPVQEETKSYIESDMFKKVYSIYSKGDMLQILDPQGLQKKNKNKKTSFFSGRRFTPCDKLKQIKIKINNQSIMHAGFLRQRFLKILPSLLDTMDSIKCDDQEHLVKVEYKNGSITQICK